MGANVDTLHRLYDAFGTGDVPTVLGAMDEKIDWQEPTGLPFDNQVGPQAVAENVFGPVTTQLQGFSVAPHDFIDGGDIVAVTGMYSGKGAANGVALEAEFVHVWRFGGDGKITGFRTYTDTHLWRQALGTD